MTKAGPSRAPSFKKAKKNVKKFAAKKEKCKYWSKCYRKEKAHLAEFLHPGDKENKDDDGGEDANSVLFFVSYLCLVGLSQY